MQVEKIIYSIADATYEGVLIFDAEAGPKPGVLMAPNWMGVNDDAIATALDLATGRYTVFIADMYGEGRRPGTPPQAAALADPLRADPVEARLRINAAFDTLLRGAGKRGVLESGHLAAIGFCFGGGNVLDLARSGALLQAAVSIHGDLATPMMAGPGDIKAAVLAIHGAEDPVAPKVQRDALEHELAASGCKWRMLTFGGLLHAFTDAGADVPGIALYDAPATRVTFETTHRFIQDAFDGLV